MQESVRACPAMPTGQGDPPHRLGVEGRCGEQWAASHEEALAQGQGKSP